jgi:hypothetical protein
MSANGSQVASGVVTAGDKEVFTVQGLRLGAIIVEVLDTDTVPVAAPVEVTVHPLNPQGEPYATGVDDLKLAEEVIAASASAVLVDMKDAPGTGFAITVDNTDTDDHEVVINVLVQGE